MLRSTASHKEHRKEVTIAIVKNSSRRDTIRLPIQPSKEYVIARQYLTSLMHCGATEWLAKQVDSFKTQLTWNESGNPE